jgi:hypothetical protein
MLVPAASPYPVRAAGTLPVGLAGQHQPPLRLARVDPAEAGSRKGHEQPRMGRHRVGDALATLEAGGQELVGVGPIGGRTRRAPGLAASAARLQQHPIRLPLAVVDGADLTGLVVGVLDPAGEADRVVAVAGLGDQLGPPRVAVTSPLHDLHQDTGEQLPHPGRLAHAASSGAGIGGRTRSPGACSASSPAGSRRRPAVARMRAATWW